LEDSRAPGRAIKWKSVGSTANITEDGAHRVHNLEALALEHPSSEQDKREEEETLRQALRGILPHPEIELPASRVGRKSAAGTAACNWNASADTGNPAKGRRVDQERTG